MQARPPSYSMEVYLEMCDRMAESIVSHLEYREFEKQLGLQNEDKWKKNAMKNYCEQLRKYLREQLRLRFEQVAAEHGLGQHLKERFDAQQRVAVIESLNVISGQLRHISLQAYYEMLEETARRIVGAADHYQEEREKMHQRLRSRPQSQDANP